MRPDGNGDATGVARLGIAGALAFTGPLTLMNLAYAPLVAAGRTWQGVDDYLATWHWTEFGPQTVGLVALPAFALLPAAVHRTAAAVSWLVVLPVAALHVVVWFRRLDPQPPSSPPARVLVGAATQAGQQP
jgi:hypothetical protein